MFCQWNGVLLARFKATNGNGRMSQQHDREWVWISSLIRFVLESGNPECSDSESSLKDVFCFDTMPLEPILSHVLELKSPLKCRHCHNDSPVLIIVCWWYPRIVFAFLRWFCVPNLKEKTWNEPSESPKPSFTRFVCRGYGQVKAFFSPTGGEITRVLVIPTPRFASVARLGRRLHTCGWALGGTHHIHRWLWPNAMEHDLRLFMGNGIQACLSRNLGLSKTFRENQ